MNYKVLSWLAVSLLITLSSCAFQKLVKNGSVDEKYDAAVKLYESGDYSRALQLFDQVSGAVRATEKAQKTAYLYPFCYYKQKDYTLAAYYFKRYTTSYPTTPEAEECLFMSAYCNYLNSPDYSLDQTVTQDAIKELQLFTNTYPGSKRVSECNDLIDELRLKLEYKDYRIAKLYYRMEDYAASVQVFGNILKDFPETPHKEEILYLIFKSYFRYASESIPEKQKERFAKVLSSYGELASQFPSSKYLSEATLLKERSKKQLDALNSIKPEVRSGEKTMTPMEQ